MSKILFYMFAVSIVLNGSACAAQSAQLPIPEWTTEAEWKRLSIQQRIAARETELIVFYNNYITEKGYRFGSGAEYDFKRAARKAAERIENLPPNVQQLNLKQVQEVFIQVVDTMIEASSVIPGYKDTHYRVIGEQTLYQALSKLCPIWPFCEKPKG